MRSTTGGCVRGEATENEAVVNQERDSSYDRVSIDVMKEPIQVESEEQVKGKEQSQEVVDKKIQKTSEAKNDIADKSQKVDDVIQMMVDNSVTPLPMVPLNSSPKLGVNDQVVVTLSKEQLAELAAMITFNIEKNGIRRITIISRLSEIY